jgi:hypothetical protein
MKRRLMALIGVGVVFGAVVTGTVFARDITSNATPTLEDQIQGLAPSYESENSEGQSVYIDLRNREWQWPIEADGQ